MLTLKEALIGKKNIKDAQTSRIYAFAVGNIPVQNELKKLPKVWYITQSWWGVFITDDYKTYSSIQTALEKDNAKSWWTGYVEGARSISDAEHILKKCSDPAEKIIKIAGPSEV